MSARQSWNEVMQLLLDATRRGHQKVHKPKIYKVVIGCSKKLQGSGRQSWRR